MKAILVVVAILGIASALPQPQKLGFKNLFVEPKVQIGSKPHPRIIGGHEAEPHSIPHQVFMTVYGAGGGWYCGGSLIKQNVVLTAGHCGADGDSAELVLGAHRPLQQEDTQVIVTSENIIVHPKFDINVIANDIALIKLDKPIELNNNIKTVPLADDPSKTYEGETATVSGWGLTDGFDNKLSDVLNTLDSTVISNKECASVFDIIQDSNICITGEDNTGSCNGDSGGPLTVGGVQVGIVSFGVRYCLPGYPSAFTRVTSYLDFINQNS